MESAFVFMPLEGLEKTPPCRVPLSFEPAFAGWVPPGSIRLGRSLSRNLPKIGALLQSVGSKPECGITHIAGSITLYHKN